MLKDVSTSRRLDTLIQPKKAEIPVHALQISALFWPEDSPARNGADDEFTPHPVVQRALDAYQQEFRRIRSDRKLEWYHREGTVRMQLDFDGDRAPLEVECSPLKANVILVFSSDLDDVGRVVDVDRVCQELGVSESEANQAIAYWLRGGVLEKHDAGYRIIENAPASTGDDSGSELDGHDGMLKHRQGDETVVNADVPAASSGSAGASQIDDAQYTMISNFATGLLTNMGDMTSSDVFARLKILLVPMGISVSEEGIQHVLERMCNEERLECSGGMFSIHS